MREWKHDRTLTFGHDLVQVRPQTCGFAQYFIIGRYDVVCGPTVGELDLFFQ